MKVAVITGAAQGMGYAVAEELAREGDRVYLVDIRETVLEKAALLREKGYDARAFVCDVTSKVQVRDSVACLFKEENRLDKLVNAAGISASLPFIADDADEVLDKVMAVNFMGTWNFCRHVVPLMLRQKSGSIVNFSSVTGPVASDPGMCAYAASKGAVYAFTKSLALELAEAGISVNAVMPGYVWTDMIARYDPENPQKLKEKFSRGIPMGRMAEVEDVAPIVAFLLSEKARYMTGQGLIIDGGSTLVETKEILKKGEKKL